MAEIDEWLKSSEPSRAAVWIARARWRGVQVRTHAARAVARPWRRATILTQDLAWRLARARSRLAQRRHFAEPARELAVPMAVGTIATGLAFVLTASLASAFSVGAWVFLVAMLLAMRSSQRRHTAVLQHELSELKQLLHVTQALLQVEELEDAEQITDLQDEDTRAVRPRKTRASAWHKRLRFSWRS